MRLETPFFYSNGCHQYPTHVGSKKTPRYQNTNVVSLLGWLAPFLDPLRPPIQGTVLCQSGANLGGPSSAVKAYKWAKAHYTNDI